ncbi:aspartate aminotransferase family protein [Tistrella mobilis]|uniref:aspartate aminotransferase family protein n=1 Tax=Tistrella mobilis TaxID=171437 RepID=UPI00355900CE
MIPAVMPTYARTDLTFDKGEGAYLYTADGRRFLDFASGIAVNALGHSHPHLVSALTEQVGKLWHVSNLYQSPGQEKAAERLVAATFADTVFFSNSGAEAIECGIKMVRRYFDLSDQPGRYRIITVQGAFHGRTLATLAAAGNKKYLDGYDPVVDGFDHVPFGDLAAAEAAVTDETAAILIEPVQGEGGMRPAALDYLRGLRKLCDQHGLLLFLDEVQCGFGRTGKLFAHEWAGITPDIMAVAKGIGSGFPMGACLATEKVAAVMGPGTHGSTFGGNALAMAACNAVLDVMLEDGFLDRVRQASERLWGELSQLIPNYPGVLEEIRGAGLMLGLKCVVANGRMVDAFRANGLLTVPAGDNVVRLLPPLIIGDAEIDQAIDAIRRACDSVASEVATEEAAG